MGFNSFHFILMFLPAVYAGFVAVHRLFGWNAVYAYLALVSLFFYSYFSLVLGGILAMSVLFNFAAAATIRRQVESGGSAGATASLAVLANLVALGYFKYTNFFIDITNTVSGSGISHIDLIVPVGVSFFTFTQIGFLVETLNGQTGRVGFARYALFATFFPVVTAGPLLLQREIFPQMEGKRGPAFSTVALSVGLTMFGIGLFKKVILADSIAPYADLAFNGVALGASVGMLEAWIGSLCYALQLYFDFSGYSDMAVGLGFMFGLKLPLNFNSPFKASSISGFWRRWHMTMTRFFTTYLYMPMAMKNTRRATALGYSPIRRWLIASAMPVTYTFLIAGIWHGAGYNFVVFGLIHGIALAINHGWQHFRMPPVGVYAGWALTMATVVAGLVVFRAENLDVATTILASMIGLEGLNGGFDPTDIVTFDLFVPLAMIVLYGAVVLTAPNSQEILRNHWVSCDPELESASQVESNIRWRPNAAWAVVAAIMLVVAFTSLGANGNFLYYKF